MADGSDDGSTLRVVLFREADYWLAQALESDIGAQGEHLVDLLNRLRLALEAETDLTALPPAPKYFQDLWPARAGAFEPLAPVQPPAPYRRLLMAMAA